MKLVKKAYKGEAGYIDYERFSRMVRTAILFIIPLAALVGATLYFGTRQNIITVIAMVGMIPACMSAVSVILVYTIRSIPKKLFEEIQPRTGSLTMAYDLYMTNYDKNTLFDAIAVCGDTVVGLATFKNPDRKEAETHIGNVLRQDGFRANVSVLGDEKKFLERLDSLNAHAESIRAGVKRREDDRYPEETYEEQILHILMQVSL